MHAKIITPGSQDFHEPVASLVKFSSRGLVGDDLRRFAKRASAEFAHKIASLRPGPGEEIVHLLAVGATERFGANRNGDGFRREVCRRHHPTFVKHARFFRHHCFPAGTLVTMADRSRRPIEDVLEGDLVGTMDGPKRVTRVMRRHYRGPGKRLHVTGVQVPLVATADHPVLAHKWSQMHCRHKYSRLNHGRAHGLRCREWRSGLADMDATYLPASDLASGDYLLTPKPACGLMVVEPEFARLVGWVASEGYVNRAGGIHFTFAAANEADIASVSACLRANGLSVGRTDREDGLVQLWSQSVDLSRELSKYIVGVKSRKRLTGAVLEWDRGSLLELLAAYIEGDGHVADGKNKGQLRIRSSSRRMLYALSDVIHAVGAPVTVCWDSPARMMVSPTNGKSYPADGSGVVAVRACDAAPLARETRKLRERPVSRVQPRQELNGNYLRRIRKITDVELDETVYNLEVEEAHHYIANEVVVHNCNKNPAKSYGLVKFSGYNETMDRIELGVALNADDAAAKRNGGLVADRELEKLASGSDIPVSMAAYVSQDLCSGCGNKAKTRAEYCGPELCKYGGLRDNIGKVFEDGHVLHADNPDPRFFDISHVFRPADRIAYVLGKAAAAQDFLLKAASHGVTGREAAERLGVVAPLSVLADGPWTKAATVRQLAVLQRLAAKEATQVESSSIDAALPRDDLSDAVAELRAGDGAVKLGHAARALADEQCLLPIRAFVALATGEAGPRAKQAADQAAEHLPGVFGRLAEDPDLERRLDANPYLPATISGQRARQWVAKHAAACSCGRSFVVERAQKAALRAVPPRSPRMKKAADDSAASRLAREYALYQLGLLQHLSDSPASQLTPELVLRNNYTA